MLVENLSLANRTIAKILTPTCEPVHPAWIGELTTPLATTIAVLQLADGELLMVAPCEVKLDPDQYPSLGLSIQTCDSSALQWVRDGKTYTMNSLPEGLGLLPLLVMQVEEADPLGEGVVSEIVLVGQDGSRVLFRHIFPPMTLGIEMNSVRAST